MSECLNLVPVGKLNICFRVSGPVRHPHNEADNIAIQQAVALVVYPAGEYSQVFRFPGDLLQEFSHIGIRVRLPLVGFARHHVNREESAGTVLVDVDYDIHDAHGKAKTEANRPYGTDHVLIFLV